MANNLYLEHVLLAYQTQTEGIPVQFIYTDPQTEWEQFFGGQYCINAFGTIQAGDDKVFEKFLETSGAPARTDIYIDSTGGNVEAAMEIGKLIRAGWHSTSIGRYLLQPDEPDLPMVKREHQSGQCISAATLVYLGGRLRYFPDGSQFGVHQFSFRDPSPENFKRSQSLSARIARYITEMGIEPEFLEVSSSTPSDQIDLLKVDRLRELNVVTGGQTDVEWSVQAQRGMLYVRGERDSIFGHHKVMLAYSKGTGFYFWAVIEAQGRDEELTGHSLVEIVINEEDTRIDISERCERGVYGIYVNILARLTQDEARKIAFSESFGVQVRGSKEAELFLGIAAMSTEDGREKLETLFNTLIDET